MIDKFLPSEEVWGEMKNFRIMRYPWSERGWCNNKNYTKKELRERNPYERGFYNSSGRFSPVVGKTREIDIIYLSEDWKTALTETNSCLKYNHSKSHKKFLAKGESESDEKGYPMSYSISDDTLLFGLVSPHSPFNIYLGSENLLDEFTRKITCKRSYTFSQEFAVEVFERGFDGILYKSLRERKRVNIPSTNCIIWNKEKIKRS